LILQEPSFRVAVLTNFVPSKVVLVLEVTATFTLPLIATLLQRWKIAQICRIESQPVAEVRFADAT
jgi:hypothetical protein